MPRRALLRPALRRWAANLALGAASLALSLAAAEIALRLWDYRFSPIRFLTPENVDDWRAFHMSANDPRLAEQPSLTVFDGDVLWRLNPERSPEVNAQGYRGPLLPAARRAGEVWVVAVGDSNTIGPLHSTDHWPGFVDDALRGTMPHVRVVNAGVYGYSSLQGLRVFRRLRPYRPDVVLFSFGANDAQPVETSDAEYAQRVDGLRRWEWSRLAPVFAHAWWRLTKPPANERRTFRVPLVDYRRNLEAFVDEARLTGAVPVLLTRPWLGRSDDPGNCLTYAPAYNEATRQVAAGKGVLLIDAYRQFEGRGGLYTDALHFDRVGNRLMGEFVRAQLRALPQLRAGSDPVPGPAIELVARDDRRLELGPGFYNFEQPPDGAGGRWTKDVGVLTLRRTRGERGLALDLSLRNPLRLSAGRIEVNGVPRVDFRARGGRIQPIVDISDVTGPDVEVRFVTEPQWVPSAHDRGTRDDRALGEFVHGARLIGQAFASGVELADLNQDRPELGAGWFDAEAWPDGRRGRWSGARAEVTLERGSGYGVVRVDVTFQTVRNHTDVSVEVDGRTVGRIEGANGRHERAFPLPAKSGTRVQVRLVVRRPYVPANEEPGNGDTRALGVFAHAIRLEPQSRTSSTTREPSGQGQAAAGR